jgi:vitamin B12 transporter
MDKKKITILLLVFFLFFTLCPMLAVAEETAEGKKDMPTEEITITAHRVVQSLLEQTGSSVSIITRRDMDQSKKPLAIDYLREIPGVFVSTSMPGQMSSVSIRGGESHHTLVLIDGVRVNHPMDPSGTFDFSMIPTDNIERIEVVRGPQSTVYGSQAIGGVVNIITRSGKPLAPGEEPRVNVSGITELGGYESGRLSLNIRGSMPNLGVSFGTSGLWGGALSAQRQTATRFPHPDADPYSNVSTFGKINAKPNDRLDLGLSYHNINHNAKLDTTFNDDPRYANRRRENILNTFLGYDIIEGTWNSKLSYSNLDSEYTDFFPPHYTPIARHFQKGVRNTLAWDNTVKAGDHTILTGYIQETENASFPRYDTVYDWVTWEATTTFTGRERLSHRTNSLYLQDNFNIGNRFFASAGLRHDRHNMFGGHTTYRLTGNYHLTDNFIAKGSYGTGFKSPTLDQLHNPSWGNTDLQPETSRGYDLGIEYRSNNRRHKAGLTYFSNRFENKIEFYSPDPDDWMAGQFENVARARTNGWELFGSTRLHPRFNLNANYTTMQARALLAGGLEEPLLLKPESKLVLAANYDLIPKRLLLTADMVNTGKRYDWGLVELDPFTLFNATVSYKLSQNLESYIRVENIFNTDYEYRFGYNSRGTTLFGGLKFNF